MESLCKLLGGKNDIWYARAIQLADYMLALRKLDWAPQLDAVTNTSAQSVWIKHGSGPKVSELKPGNTLQLP